MQKIYSLTEEMENLAHWGTVYTPADHHIDSQRAAFDAMYAHYSFLRDDSFLVEDGIMPGKNDVAYRIYKPITAKPADGWPLVMYLHGGGFTCGGLDSHEFLTGDMARSLDAWILCVDYRLAPENDYPAPLQDAQHAWKFLTTKLQEWQINPHKIVIAGDEAGALLSVLLVNTLDAQDVRPIGQALLNPSLSMVNELPNHSPYDTLPKINHKSLQRYFEHHVSEEFQKTIKELLVNSQMDRQYPITWIGVIRWSPLFDEGREYFQYLTEKGVNVEIYEAVDILHNAICMWRDCPNVYQYYLAFLDAIRKMFLAGSLLINND